MQLTNLFLDSIFFVEFECVDIFIVEGCGKTKSHKITTKTMIPIVNSFIKRKTLLDRCASLFIWELKKDIIPKIAEIKETINSIISSIFIFWPVTRI